MPSQYAHVYVPNLWRLFVRPVDVAEERKPLIVTVGSSLFVLALFVPSILKITRVIDWSWLWASSPLWILVLVLVATSMVAGVSYLGYLIFRLIFR